MGKLFLGAISSSDRETRILRLKAYLETTTDYRSDTALTKAHITSWQTMLSYLQAINKQYQLSEKGQANYQIAWREAEFLLKANQKQKRKNK